MKTLLAKIAVAALGLSLAAAPMAASAAPWALGVRVGGPGYVVHAHYVNPGGPCYGCYHHYWAPAPHYYGHPAGFYGYYWNGGWYQHRRWGNGIWIYF